MRIDEKECYEVKENGTSLGYLFPQYDSRKSFYKKAKVLSYNGEIYLQSYDTIVAKCSNDEVIINGWYSETTARHINEFLRQNGHSKMTKKEMMECE